MRRPTCGRCGKVMTPEDSRIRPEYFLHDACLPDELRPRENPSARCSCRAVACSPAEAELWAYGGEVLLKMDNSGCAIHRGQPARPTGEFRS
jgi:hypothetical protein